ncbi:MAG: rRNA maturation RNase YbeY [gamma proteobacterium endosymbiont of Trioza apicalis]
MFNILCNLQIICKVKLGLPNKSDFLCWLSCIFSFFQKKIEITIRIVDEKEILLLNYNYRGKNISTNILSFPVDTFFELQCGFLGDLIICRQVVEREALIQLKSLNMYWAYILIHGSLHLLGYNHINNRENLEMKNLEYIILNKL